MCKDFAQNLCAKIPYRFIRKKRPYFQKIVTSEPIKNLKLTKKNTINQTKQVHFPLLLVSIPLLIILKLLHDASNSNAPNHPVWFH